MKEQIKWLRVEGGVLYQWYWCSGCPSFWLLWGSDAAFPASSKRLGGPSLRKLAIFSALLGAGANRGAAGGTSLWSVRNWAAWQEKLTKPKPNTAYFTVITYWKTVCLGLFCAKKAGDCWFMDCKWRKLSRKTATYKQRESSKSGQNLVMDENW